MHLITHCGIMITARWTLVQSTVLRLHVVRHLSLSVTLSVCDVGGSGIRIT